MLPRRSNRINNIFEIINATNDLDSPAQLIAEHYKARWGIELFFKWIKQHLRLRRFLGRSQNAVKIQILTALIAYLLVALYRQAHHSTQPLWARLALIRASLFQRPELEIYQRQAFQRRQRTIAHHNHQWALFA